MLLAVVIAGGVAASTLLMPLDLVREEVVARVKLRTGRTIAIERASLSGILPTIGVRLENVVFPAPRGFGPEPTARIGAIDVRVSPWPLLLRRVRLVGVTLHEPRLLLLVDGDGRRSWDLSAPTADGAGVEAGGPYEAGASPTASAASPAAAAPQPRLVPQPSRGGAPLMSEASRQRLLKRLEGLAINNVRVNGATVDFRDLRRGHEHRLSAAQATLRMKSLAQPLVVEGTGVWRDEPVTISIRLASLPALLTEQPSDVAVKVAAKPAVLGYQGRLATTSFVGLDGRLTFETPAVDQLAKWLGGADMPALAGSNAAFAGLVRADDRLLSLAEIDLSIAGAKTTGTLSIEDGEELSLVRADLTAGTFDFGRIGELAGAVQALRRSRAVDPVLAPGLAPAKRAVAPARLERIDGDIRLAAANAVWRGVRLGASKTRLTLKDGRLEIDLQDAQVYGGRAKGKIALETGTVPPKVSADVTLDGIAAGDLLEDAIGTPWVAGRAKATVGVTGTGNTTEALIASLAGNASIAVEHGSVGGFNLAEFIKGTLRHRGDKAGRRPIDRTEFSELGGAFTIQGGVAETRDMVLNGPQFKLAGSGSLALAPRTLDVVVRPRSVTIPGLGAALDLTRLNVPIQIHGPWSKPAVTIDNQRLQAVIRAPERTGEIVKEVGKGLAGSKLGKRIEELINTEATGPDGERRRLKPREILERLIKKQPKPQGEQPPLASQPAPAAPGGAPPTAAPGARQ